MMGQESLPGDSDLQAVSGKEYIECQPRFVIMAKMSTCPCGWTIISPQGEGDVKKHMMMHLRDAHPGTIMTEDEIGKTIKTV